MLIKRMAACGGFRKTWKIKKERHDEAKNGEEKSQRKPNAAGCGLLRFNGAPETWLCGASGYEQHSGVRNDTSKTHKYTHTHTLIHPHKLFKSILIYLCMYVAECMLTCWCKSLCTLSHTYAKQTKCRRKLRYASACYVTASRERTKDAHMHMCVCWWMLWCCQRMRVCVCVTANAEILSVVQVEHSSLHCTAVRHIFNAAN